MASEANENADTRRTAYPAVRPVAAIAPGMAALSMRPKTTEDLEQQCNIVYAETHGMGLVMDCFRPRDGGNGLALIDVVSQRWRTDRNTLNIHIGVGFFDVLCAAGFTVFALSPGSARHFAGAEMVRHVHAGVAYVKTHAAEYGIDPERLGITGFSAGGHLGALAALEQRPGADTALRAAGLFFPPSDLVVLNRARTNEEEVDPDACPATFLFGGGLAGKSEQEIDARLRELSPRWRIPKNPIPFFLVHGSDDLVVPLRQSQDFAAALEAAGGEVELLVKEGGAHPWPEMRPESTRLADWFRQRLAA